MVEKNEDDFESKSYIIIQKSGSELMSHKSELYLYDARFDQFVRLHDKVDVCLLALGKYSFGIFIDKSGKFKCLTIENTILSQEIAINTSPTFNKEHNSFVWNWFKDGKGPFSFSMLFLKLLQGIQNRYHQM